jgi:hypothetical protein
MSEAFIKQNAALSLEFDEYLFEHPKLFKQIPNKAYIVITINGDQQFNMQSLSLIKDKRRKKIVEAHKVASSWTVRPLQPAV